jgi:hypothetical protein
MLVNPKVKLYRLLTTVLALLGCDEDGPCKNPGAVRDERGVCICPGGTSYQVVGGRPECVGNDAGSVATSERDASTSLDASLTFDAAQEQAPDAVGPVVAIDAAPRASVEDAGATGTEDAQVFDAATCQPGTPGCVQCRPETEEADCRALKSCDPATEDCPGGACDPKLSTCARKLRGTLGICEPCVSDSECVADHRCIPMTFGEGAEKKELGGFCLKRMATGCARPYASAIRNRESLSGYPAELYCGIQERIISCGAVRAFREGRPCDGTDESCGALGAICGGQAPQQWCTYGCYVGGDCANSYSCDGDLGVVGECVYLPM